MQGTQVQRTSRHKRVAARVALLGGFRDCHVIKLNFVKQFPRRPENPLGTRVARISLRSLMRAQKLSKSTQNHNIVAYGTQ